MYAFVEGFGPSGYLVYGRFGIHYQLNELNGMLLF